MSAQDNTNSSRPPSAGDDSTPQRQPTLLDIFNLMRGIEQEQVAQRVVLARLTASTTVRFEDSALRTPPGLSGQMGDITGTQDARQIPAPHHTQGMADALALQPGQIGGPFGLTPVAMDREQRPTRGRQSLGTSNLRLPPQASPYPLRDQLPFHTQAKPAATPFRQIPRDSDPTLTRIKEEILLSHEGYFRDLHPDWTDDQIHSEARSKTAEEYLAIRRRAIEDSLAGTVFSSKAAGQQRFEQTGADRNPWHRRINWDMVKIMPKLGWNNWADWRGRVFSLLGTIPGAIGILEGVTHGPGYLELNDPTSHPYYDEALDLELGQVIQSCTEPALNSLLFRLINDGELRGSFFYRELRTWLVPNQGYAALKLISKMGQHRQREDESVREFGERLRRFYLELQSAGETLDQTKQVGFLLTGLRYRFQTVRDSVVSRQAAGEAFTFEKVLHILAEAEESFGAFEDRRRAAPATKAIPPLSRPSAHVAEEDLSGYDFDEEVDDEDIQAFAVQLARHFIARRRDGQRPFNGACFTCKKPGHRASECPQGKGEYNPPPPRALAAQRQAAQDAENLVHTCGKEEARATYAHGVPAIGAFEAQVWEDELEAFPSALNVVTSA